MEKQERIDRIKTLQKEYEETESQVQTAKERRNASMKALNTELEIYVEECAAEAGIFKGCVLTFKKHGEVVKGKVLRFFGDVYERKLTATIVVGVLGAKNRLLKATVWLNCDEIEKRVIAIEGGGDGK